VLNNPLKYTDPSGHTSACAAGATQASAEDCADYTPTPKPLPKTSVSNPITYHQPDAGVDNTPASLQNGGRLIEDLAMDSSCGCGDAGNTTTNTASATAGVIVTTVGVAVDTVGKFGQGFHEVPFGYSGREWVIKNAIGGIYNEYRLLRPSWTKANLSRFGSVVNTVADIGGAGLAVIPNQINDYNSGAPWNMHVADFLIDLGIWAGASAIAAATLTLALPVIGVVGAVAAAVVVGVIVTHYAYEAMDYNFAGTIDGREVLSQLTYAADANLSYASSQVAAIDPSYRPALAGP
jgi:hypothetical protein